MFDAGAIVSRMTLDTKQWEQSMQRVQQSVQTAASRFGAMNQAAQQAVSRASAAMVDMGNAVRRAGSEISKVGQSLAFFGAAVGGPILLAFRSMRDISPQVAEQMERLKNVTQNFQLIIANAVVPIVERFVNILGGLLQAFNSMDPALRTQIIQWALIGGVTATVGGIFLAAAGKLMALGGTIYRAGGIVFAFLGPWGLLAAAIVGVITYFVGLDRVAKTVLSGLETAFYGVQAVAVGVMNFVLATVEKAAFGLQKIYEGLSKLPKFLGGDDYMVAGAQMQGLRMQLKVMIRENEDAIQKLKTKAVDAFGGNGEWAKGVDTLSQKLSQMKNFFVNLGNTKIDWAPVTSSFSMIRSAWERTAQGMASSFSNVFYDTVTGQLKSLKDYFADFGRTVLRILSDVIAKLLLARLFGSMGGPVGTAFAALAGGGAGFADGIEEVSHGGMYRLHPGEQVVPKYDAAQNKGTVVNNYNVLTTEEIAKAMSSKAGKNTIINVFRANAGERGAVRHIIKGA